MVKRKMTWLAGWLCAALTLGLVFWWRPDGEKKAGLAAEGSEPQVTKPSPRERDARERRTKNPREEFEAARKRGLTEEEVRGIVEEFLNLGIDSVEISAGSQERYYQLRVKRQAWLLDAVVSGFRLSDKQKKQAAVRLEELGKRDYEEYLAEGVLFEFDGEMVRIFNASKVRLLTDADEWLSNEGYLPWNLCDLDEMQKTMLPLKLENETWSWSRPGSVTHDYGTEQRYENLDDPFTNQNGFITPSGTIFPLSMEQVDRIRGANTFHSEKHNIIVTGRLEPVTYVKLLTAPQLMTLLLFEPEMARDLMKELGD